MYLINVSLNYHNAPLEVREKFTFSPPEIQKVDHLLNEEKSVLENLILTTCNRTEIYAVVDQIHTGRYFIRNFLAEWFEVSLSELDRYVTVNVQETAVRHLFEVAVGLDFKIKGESQILGQVKQAFQEATSAQSIGNILNHLFRQAITFAKKMHTDYRVSELAQSSSQAALHQIKQYLGTVNGKKLAVVGAGKWEGKLRVILAQWGLMR